MTSRSDLPASSELVRERDEARKDEAEGDRGIDWLAARARVLVRWKAYLFPAAVLTHLRERVRLPGEDK
jgi:hypothetical protein